jgi:hypothetical protein
MHIDDARGEPSVNYHPFKIEKISVSNKKKRNNSVVEKTLSVLITAYMDECGVAWTKSTRSANNTVFKFLKMALGENKKLRDIDRNVSREVFEKLRRLPKNWGKHPKLKGLSLNQLIDKAEKLGLPLNH